MEMHLNILFYYDLCPLLLYVGSISPCNGHEGPIFVNRWRGGGGGKYGYNIL